MIGQSARLVGTTISIALLLWIARAQTFTAQSASEAVQSENAKGWQIPERAIDEKSPSAPTSDLLKNGRGLFKTRCQKCHGPEGKGNGPDGDKERPPADLTASRNLDGVMFYKVWNGRKNPTMPAFKSMMTKDEIWTVIEYAKSLRKEPVSP